MDGEKLGSYLRQLREAQNISLTDMARRIGTTKGYLSLIESGQRQWPQKYIPALARELGVTELELAFQAGIISEIVTDQEGKHYGVLPGPSDAGQKEFNRLVWEMDGRIREMIAAMTPVQKRSLWAKFEAASPGWLDEAAEAWQGLRPAVAQIDNIDGSKRNQLLERRRRKRAAES